MCVCVFIVFTHVYIMLLVPRQHKAWGSYLYAFEWQICTESDNAWGWLDKTAGKHHEKHSGRLSLVGWAAVFAAVHHSHARTHTHTHTHCTSLIARSRSWLTALIDYKDCLSDWETSDTKGMLIASSQRKQREQNRDESKGRRREPPFSLLAPTAATPCPERALLIPHCPVKPLAHMQDCDEQQDAQELPRNVFEPHSGTFVSLTEVVLKCIFASHHPSYFIICSFKPLKKIFLLHCVWISVFSQLVLIHHVQTCTTGQSWESRVQTYKCWCLCFCLLASSILREGEEHVPWWDQDPPRASWTLLKPATGRTVSIILRSLNHITFTAKLSL